MSDEENKKPLSRRGRNLHSESERDLGDWKNTKKSSHSHKKTEPLEENKEIEENSEDFTEDDLNISLPDLSSEKEEEEPEEEEENTTDTSNDEQPTETDDAPKPKKRLWKKLLISTLTIIILAGGVVLGIFLYQKAQEVNIPKATETIEIGQIEKSCEPFTKAGLNCSIKEEFSDLDRGALISQSIKPGEIVKKERNIVLTYSKGNKFVELPNLSGMDIKDATEELEKIGLSFGGETKVDNTDIPEGKIVKSNVESGTTLLNGTKIFVDVASGAFDMPDWVGLTKDEVAIDAEKLGVEVEFVEEESDKTAGIVLKQSVKASDKVTEDKITVTISKNEKSVELTMPDVVGMTEEDAQAKLAVEGFKHIKIVEVVNTDIDKAKITETVPSANQKVNSEENIVLIKSKPE